MHKQRRTNWDPISEHRKQWNNRGDSTQLVTNYIHKRIKFLLQFWVKTTLSLKWRKKWENCKDVESLMMIVFWQVFWLSNLDEK